MIKYQVEKSLSETMLALLLIDLIDSFFWFDWMKSTIRSHKNPNK